MTTTTNTTKPRPTTPPQPTRAGSASTAPAAPSTPATDEAPIDEQVLALAKDAATSVADTFLTTTGLRPLYATQQTVWQGAARVMDGEPIAEVVKDAVVPRRASEIASLVRGIDAMKPGDELSAAVEVTAAFEGIAGRRQVELEIARSEHGFTVALADSSAAGLLAAEHEPTSKTEIGAFGRVGSGVVVEVDTADEAKELAQLMAAATAVSGGTAVNTIGMAVLTMHPGLRELELSAGILGEASVGPPTEAELAELGLEGAGSAGAGAKFVAGSPPELVVSFDVELEGEVEVAAVLGAANLGSSASAEGKLTKELRYALPQGTTPADVPGLVARGQACSEAPRVQWRVEASVRGLDGKAFAIDAELQRDGQDAGIKEGTLQWRSTRSLHLEADELHAGTGGKAGASAQRSTLLRQVEFSSASELERALRSAAARTQ